MSKISRLKKCTLSQRLQTGQSSRPRQRRWNRQNPTASFSATVVAVDGGGAAVVVVDAADTAVDDVVGADAADTADDAVPNSSARTVVDKTASVERQGSSSHLLLGLRRSRVGIWLYCSFHRFKNKSDKNFYRKNVQNVQKSTNYETKLGFLGSKLEATKECFRK